MSKLKGMLSYALANFGPLLVFYISNHFFGLRTAIISSVVWVLGEIVFQVLNKRPLSLFFKFSALITIVFGLIDLYLQKSFLFKYEASLTNVMVGVFFALSLINEKPIIREFAEAQGRISKNLTPDGEFYFKFLTVVWACYMFIKAGFYFWVAEKYNLEEGLAIRASLGNISFYALLGLSIFASNQIKFVLAKARMLPSSRARKTSLTTNISSKPSSEILET
jgi:intracellular septation protein A